jgi:hypothetical protein
MKDFLKIPLLFLSALLLTGCSKDPGAGLPPKFFMKKATHSRGWLGVIFAPQYVLFPNPFEHGLIKGYSTIQGFLNC